MTDEQKREQIRFLYQQLDKCGQMIAEDDEWGAARREYNPAEDGGGNTNTGGNGGNTGGGGSEQGDNDLEG